MVGSGKDSRFPEFVFGRENYHWIHEDETRSNRLTQSHSFSPSCTLPAKKCMSSVLERVLVTEASRLQTGAITVVITTPISIPKLLVYNNLLGRLGPSFCGIQQTPLALEDTLAGKRTAAVIKLLLASFSSLYRL